MMNKLRNLKMPFQVTTFPKTVSRAIIPRGGHDASTRFSKAERWSVVRGSKDWDRYLAMLSGHPLQTALWGDSREAIDGIKQMRFRGTTEKGRVFALARIEIRKIPMLGSIAWLSRGPVVASNSDFTQAKTSLDRELRSRGFTMSAVQPWHEVSGTANTEEGPQTILIDLSVGEERLFTNLESQWRYGVRRAGREGVVVEQTTDMADVADFYRLCSQISEAKGFQLPGSQALIQHLLDNSTPGADVEARLFVARCDGRLGAGAVVMRCGTSAHYLWGGVDRELSRCRVGEAVQWSVIQWAVARGCRSYDLEGIDPVSNPGTYKFKRKMGGREVALPAMETNALRVRGVLLKYLVDRRR